MLPEVTDLQTYFPHLEEFEHRGIFSGVAAPWEAVTRIRAYTIDAVDGARGRHGERRPRGVRIEKRTMRWEETILIVDSLVEVDEPFVVQGASIFLDRGVVLEPGAMIKSPAYLGAETEVRQGAYLRGDVLTGRGCTLGHTTEIKNSVFMNHTEAGHFAYVGDSILGSHVNLGAGTKLANLQFRRSADKIAARFPRITLRFGGERFPTELSKLGCLLGDHAETGCNSVISPGVFCGAHTWVHATLTVPKGYYAPRSIIR